jgi:hypothetical protein
VTAAAHIGFVIMRKNFFRRLKMIEKISPSILHRREFVRRLVTTGSLVCLGSSGLFAMLRSTQEEKLQKAKHKFLEDSGLTYEQVYQLAVGNLFIPVMNEMADKVGMDVIKEASADAATKRVKEFVEKLEKRDLATFAGFFKAPNPISDHSLTKEIIQDTDNVFEMKVTECLWAKTFREAEAADLGFNCICFADYPTAKAFNPKITLIRDKTLMQGHDYCNHKYVFKV